jgi:hypothetical protein
MKIKIISGILLITFSIIISSITCVAVEEKKDLNDNILKQIYDDFTERIHRFANIQPNIIWYPGFLITLLLAPFIILYLIIAIILDIANP